MTAEILHCLIELETHLAELPVVLPGQEHCSGHLHSQSLDWPFCVARGVASEIYEIRSEVKGGRQLRRFAS